MLECTTREKRPSEIDNDDYEFISNEEFDKLLVNNLLCETVLNQFPPGRYGARTAYLDKNKWNVVVASIEGFLSSVKYESSNTDSELVLINIINDVDLDINREGRNPQAEENINKSVLYQFKDSDITLNIFSKEVKYIELPLSKLKSVRDDSMKLISLINSYLLK